MGVYVKDATAPKNCTGCIAVHYYVSIAGDAGMLCEVTSLSMDDYYSDGRPDWCPLVEVPEPHGRLIDAEQLKETLDYYIREAGWSDEINKALSWVKNEFINSEPTVIQASEEDE